LNSHPCWWIFNP